MDTIGADIKHTHRASTVALSSTVIRTCEILSSQRIKASSKRLLYICHPMPSHLRRGFRMGTYGKYTENNPTIRNFLLQKFSLTYKALYYNYLQIIKEHKIILRKTEINLRKRFFILLRLIFYSAESKFTCFRGLDSGRKNTVLFYNQRNPPYPGCGKSDTGHPLQKD